METTSQLSPTGLFGYGLRMVKHFDNDITTVKEILSTHNALKAVGIKRENGAMIDDPSHAMEINKNDSVVMLIREGKNSDITQEKTENIIWSENEENIMRKYDYPGLDQQIKEHRQLTKEVMELNKGKQYVFPENIIEFLNFWLLNHIMSTDKKLGEFLTERGIR